MMRPCSTLCRRTSGGCSNTGPTPPRTCLWPTIATTCPTCTPRRTAAVTTIGWPRTPGWWIWSWGASARKAPWAPPTSRRPRFAGGHMVEMEAAKRALDGCSLRPAVVSERRNSAAIDLPSGCCPRRGYPRALRRRVRRLRILGAAAGPTALGQGRPRRPRTHTAHLEETLAAMRPRRGSRAVEIEELDWVPHYALGRHGGRRGEPGRRDGNMDSVHLLSPSTLIIDRARLLRLFGSISPSSVTCRRPSAATAISICDYCGATASPGGWTPGRPPGPGAAGARPDPGARLRRRRAPLPAPGGGTVAIRRLQRLRRGGGGGRGRAGCGGVARSRGCRGRRARWRGGAVSGFALWCSDAQRGRARSLPGRPWAETMNAGQRP